MYSEDILKSLDQQTHRTIYAKLIALNADELPLEEVEGSITSGSINLDGQSAVRRACQFTMVTDKINISNYYWGLNTKFKLSIGAELNNDIIWFDQGIYVITSFNVQLSASSYTISLSGKDKMCLLNGEVGGVLNSSIDFGQIDQQIGTDSSGHPIYKTIKYPIKDIIREAVHTYGGEPFHNIVISDLDEMGLELQEYRYDVPMYIWRPINDSVYINGTLNGEQSIDGIYSKLTDIPEEEFESLTGNFALQENKAVISFPGDTNQYYVAKIDYGESAGYKEIDLVYPDTLIANAGDSLTSVLDKIKKFLGNFEYFYNTYGQFVFQKKKDYITTPWSPIDSNGVINSLEKYSYIFSDSKNFTAISNTPNLLSLKNDFTVWGARKNTATGDELPIHMRYAIDKKPVRYVSVQVDDEELKDYNVKMGLNVRGQESITYIASDYYEKIDNIVYCDWRELIYQMAKDYRKYNHLDNFELKLMAANGVTKTGYEQYYIDLEGFWRQLYNPINEYAHYSLEKLEQLEKQLQELLEAEGEYEAIVETLAKVQNAIQLNKDFYICDDTDRFGWARAIYENPEQLNFWLDFLDSSGELNSFSVQALGSRPKVVNDKDVKAIYYREVPAIIFQNEKDGSSRKTGYRYFNAPNMKEMFIKGARGKSAKDEIDTLLYNHSYCAESINISSIPIYFLEPNTCIYISDSDTGIQGEYSVSRISIPLSYNGTMSVVATKLPQRIL